MFCEDFENLRRDFTLPHLEVAFDKLDFSEVAKLKEDTERIIIKNKLYYLQLNALIENCKDRKT